MPNRTPSSGGGARSMHVCVRCTDMLLRVCMRAAQWPTKRLLLTVENVFQYSTHTLVTTSTSTRIPAIALLVVFARRRQRSPDDAVSRGGPRGGVRGLVLSGSIPRVFNNADTSAATEVSSPCALAALRTTRPTLFRTSSSVLDRMESDGCCEWCGGGDGGGFYSLGDNDMPGNTSAALCL